MTDRRRAKKVYPTGVAHPAPFSDAILPVMASLLDSRHRSVLDPFAGVGRIHELPALVDWQMDTTGVEIEPEWAALHERTLVGNAVALDFADGEFDAVVTSPTYGNRLADSHNARDGSLRRSYTHDLGRKLSEKNSGSLHWGEAYREFHRIAWREAARVLRPGGRLVLNISDHIRQGKRQYVSSWHVETIISLGLVLVDATRVETPRHREGANSQLRVASELVVAFDKPD
jgi:SAM-dependent methyltransferase